MADETQKIIDEQEREIQRLKDELKKAVSLKSFGSVLIRTIKKSIQDIFDREQKIKRQTERIRELEKELSNISSNKTAEEDDNNSSLSRDVSTSEEIPSKAKILFEKCSFKALQHSNPSSCTENEIEEKNASPDRSEVTVVKESRQKDVTPKPATDLTSNNTVENLQRVVDETPSNALDKSEDSELPSSFISSAENGDEKKFVQNPGKLKNDKELDTGIHPRGTTDADMEKHLKKVTPTSENKNSTTQNKKQHQIDNQKKYKAHPNVPSCDRSEITGKRNSGKSPRNNLNNPALSTSHFNNKEERDFNSPEDQALPEIMDALMDEVALEVSALEYPSLPKMELPDASMMDEDWDDDMVF